MKLQVNGKARELEDGLTLARFITGLELGKVRVAVERNFDIVPRDRYADTALEDGDRLEIVTFVGGG